MTHPLHPLYGYTDAVGRFFDQESMYDINNPPAHFLLECGHPRPLWRYRAAVQLIAMGEIANHAPGYEVCGVKKPGRTMSELCSLRDHLRRIRGKVIRDGCSVGVSPFEMGSVLDRIYKDCCDIIDDYGSLDENPAVYAVQRLCLSVVPVDDLLASLRGRTPESNGPLPPDKFRYGKAVAEHLSTNQFLLLSLLWDAKSRKPADSQSVDAFFEHVCPYAGNQMEALRKLRSRTQTALTNANIPLTIRWESSALSLIIDK